jgi:hypothetical protein
MATTFQLAHCVEEATFTSAEQAFTTRPVWAVHEVESTVDFCPRNPVLTWALGGLNFRSSTICSRSCRIRTTPRSPRSFGATAPSTASATRHNHLCEPRCARTSCTSAQWPTGDTRRDRDGLIRRPTVDPSTSVKRTVTVPVGRSDLTRRVHPRQWRSRLAAHPSPSGGAPASGPAHVAVRSQHWRRTGQLAGQLHQFHRVPHRGVRTPVHAVLSRHVAPGGASATLYTQVAAGSSRAPPIRTCW